jgi:hypothetical protein
MDEYLTAEETAALMRRPLRTLYRWRTLDPAYGPPGIRVGKALLYKRADVVAWIDAEQRRQHPEVGETAR